MSKSKTVALAVQTKPGIDYFRRGGIRFERTEKVVRLDDVSEAQVESIKSEPMLHWRELDEIPDGPLPLHRTREELELENQALKERVAELEAERDSYAPAEENLDDMNVPELRDLCGTRGIPYSGLRRDELIAALRGQGASEEE